MLITPPEILRKTAGNNNELDQGKLLPSIELAELRFLMGRDCLGADYYSSLAAQKNQVVTQANLAQLQGLFNAQHALPDTGPAPQLQVGMIVNAAEFLDVPGRELWELWLWKYTAECVLYLAEADNYLQFSSQGLTKPSPINSALGDTTSDSSGATLQDVKYVQEKRMRERIEPLRHNLMQYLEARAGNYPVWSRCRPSSPARMTGYIDLSIYRDQDDGGRRCCNFGQDQIDPLLW